MSSPRRSGKTTKHSLRLRPGDVATIQAAFPTIGANAAIRNHLASWVDTMRARGEAADIEVPLDKEPPTNAEQ